MSHLDIATIIISVVAILISIIAMIGRPEEKPPRLWKDDNR